MLFFMFTENDLLRGRTQVVFLNPLSRGKGGGLSIKKLETVRICRIWHPDHRENQIVIPA